MTVKLYVEGGGDHDKSLATACRRGFSEYLRKAGLAGQMPRIIVCGARSLAFRDFEKAIRDAGDLAVLLVDSETEVLSTPWEHVANRPGDLWKKPALATDNQLHFMTQCMEAWFYCDKDAIAAFYKRGFRVGKLSKHVDIEKISKQDLFEGLKQATKECQKGEYAKGGHSFQILAMIDPKKVREASKSADRLLTHLALINPN